MHLPSTRQTKIASTARAGVWVSTIALCLLGVLIGYFAVLSMINPADLGWRLAGAIGLSGPPPTLNTGQAAVVAAIWLMTHLVGGAMMLVVRKLFAGIRDGAGIFTTATALRLRSLGWIVLLLAPLSMIVTTITGSLLGYWADPTALRITVGFEDAEMYAVTLGLVLVAFGHIMVDATRLAEENRAFV